MDLGFVIELPDGWQKDQNEKGPDVYKSPDGEIIFFVNSLYGGPFISARSQEFQNGIRKTLIKENASDIFFDNSAIFMEREAVIVRYNAPSGQQVVSYIFVDQWKYHSIYFISLKDPLLSAEVQSMIRSAHFAIGHWPAWAPPPFELGQFLVKLIYWIVILFLVLFVIRLFWKKKTDTD
ncbi:hypothetical protein [Leptospira congkakensis]|uniref:hypothetical protein n=1 Tax=Leptospira congkakensis TaxID=2484932 RepID=UPI00108359A8|nr:hypothetical protein [Leptospira congkakensis]